MIVPVGGGGGGEQSSTVGSHGGGGNCARIIVTSRALALMYVSVDRSTAKAVIVCGPCRASSTNAICPRSSVSPTQGSVSRVPTRTVAPTSGRPVPASSTVTTTSPSIVPPPTPPTDSVVST